MKFDKRHLIGSVILLVGSIGYNVWVFTKPAPRATTANQGAPVAATSPSAGAITASAAVSPTGVPAPPDVALDQPPQWPRDPFANANAAMPVPTDSSVATTSAPAPIPDPVVASILYSPQRRLAMIGGRAIGVGDVVGDSKVVDIQPRAVVIESPGGDRKTLDLKAPQTLVKLVQKPLPAPPPASRPAPLPNPAP